MFYIIAMEKRKYRTWEDIVKEFPMSNIVMSSVDIKGASETSGTVCAYTVDTTSEDMDDLYEYACKNDYWATTTLNDTVYTN